MNFKAEGRVFAKFLRSLEQFIQTVKDQNNFWQQDWKKLLGFRNMQEKLKKDILENISSLSTMCFDLLQSCTIVAKVFLSTPFHLP